MDSLTITDTIPLLITTTACVACAVIDIRSFRVPNVVTLPLLISGLIYQAVFGGWNGVWLSLGGAGFGFAILIVPHVFGAMGAGDVKLLAGIGAWLGRPMTANVLLVAVLFGGLYAFALLAMTGRLGWMLTRIWAMLTLGQWRAEAPVERILDRSDPTGRLVPFAAMIAVGLLSVSLYR